jgi:excisionase family DNA binding protein
MPPDGFDLLTVREVAQLLHCSKAHICNLVAGRVHGCEPMPALRLGRRMLVRREALAMWIEHSEHASADDNLDQRQNEAGKRG